MQKIDHPENYVEEEVLVGVPMRMDGDQRLGSPETVEEEIGISDVQRNLHLIAHLKNEIGTPNERSQSRALQTIGGGVEPLPHARPVFIRIRFFSMRYRHLKIGFVLCFCYQVSLHSK